ncbi:hypothetical protein ACFR97_01150 [Haloplanus litoreus]|uniref:Uncharacterized protein n=1 Tax=Haloplanus litoreus TaxID=767515 RepID=A0ABD5ZUY8_9EURY
MAVTKRRRFVHAQLAWMLATALVLALLDSLAYEPFFVVSFAGFLIVAELTTPVRVTPAWRQRLRWLVLLGLAGFAYVVAERALGVLPTGVS